MMYYVARDGQQYGPYSDETIRQYLAAGSLMLTDHAREESGQTWLTLAQFFPPAIQAPVVITPQPYTSGPAYGQQQVYGQQPAYGQQAYVQQQFVPPDFHWALVLLLSAFTGGVFGFVWVLIQANFARKIDAASKATIYYILGIVAMLVYIIMYFSAVAAAISNNMQMTDAIGATAAIAMLFALGGWIFLLAGAYSVRASMLKYYNTVEPIQLQLSGVMTFFFSTLYLQHHLSRIAAWKKTGYLSA